MIEEDWVREMIQRYKDPYQAQEKEEGWGLGDLFSFRRGIDPHRRPADAQIRPKDGNPTPC